MGEEIKLGPLEFETQGLKTTYVFREHEIFVFVHEHFGKRDL